MWSISLPQAILPPALKIDANDPTTAKNWSSGIKVTPNDYLND